MDPVRRLLVIRRAWRREMGGRTSERPIEAAVALLVRPSVVNLSALKLRATVYVVVALLSFL